MCINDALILNDQRGSILKGLMMRKLELSDKNIFPVGSTFV